MMQNHFAIGVEICHRIRDTVPDVRQVRLAASLQEIADWQPVTPAVWVVWDGDIVSDTAGHGRAQVVRQRWVVALIVRSARDADTGSGVVESAGPILSSLLGALMGWPALGTPLRRVNAPSPGYGAGYGIFPIAFEASITLTGG